MYRARPALQARILLGEACTDATVAPCGQLAPSGMLGSLLHFLCVKESSCCCCACRGCFCCSGVLPVPDGLSSSTVLSSLVGRTLTECSACMQMEFCDWIFVTLVSDQALCALMKRLLRAVRKCTTELCGDYIARQRRRSHELQAGFKLLRQTQLTSTSLGRHKGSTTYSVDCNNGLCFQNTFVAHGHVLVGLLETSQFQSQFSTEAAYSAQVQLISHFQPTTWSRSGVSTDVCLNTQLRPFDSERLLSHQDCRLWPRAFEVMPPSLFDPDTLMQATELQVLHNEYQNALQEPAWDGS